MLRWVLLFLAGICFGLGLLTLIRSPDWSFWQLALLAGEYGHWAVIAPLTVLCTAWLMRNATVLSTATMLVSVAAIALLLKPSFQAFHVADQARADLDRFGAPGSAAAEAFSLARYFVSSEAPVPVETFNYADHLALDFYRATQSGPAPCVVVIHGGGWDSGNRKQLDGLNHWLARRGYAVAAISYRLAPQFKWPAQMQDGLAAMAYLKAHATKLGIDPTRFVLLGRSAGGQIAESLAYTTNDPAIRGLVALYSPADMRFAWEFGREDDVLHSLSLRRNFLGGSPAEVPAAYDSASPILAVRLGLPPTLLIHGELDTLVWHRQSERLAAQLSKAGVPHVFISLPWATHAFEYHLSGPGGQVTRYALERFLARVVGGPRSD